MTDDGLGKVARKNEHGTFIAPCILNERSATNGSPGLGPIGDKRPFNDNADVNKLPDSRRRGVASAVSRPPFVFPSRFLYEITGQADNPNYLKATGKRVPKAKSPKRPASKKTSKPAPKRRPATKPASRPAKKKPRR